MSQNLFAGRVEPIAARGGDRALLPRLRDVGHRRPSPARRARRPEAGAPPDPVAMHEQGLRPDRPYRKSANVVGDVMGKYHPHGDAAIYDALVRMAQDFSLRYPLIDPHGNFGSLDGDPAGASRYTEARLGAARDGDAPRHRRRDRRLRAELRRLRARSRSCSPPVPEPARERRRRHRGRHGHEHPAAQPRRGDRRGGPPDRRARGHAGRPDEVRQGPRLPDGRLRDGQAGDQGRLHDGPRLDQGPREDRRSRRARAGAARSSSPSCRTRSTRRAWRRRSRSWSRPARSRTSPTSRTTPAAATVCAWRSS